MIETTEKNSEQTEKDEFEQLTPRQKLVIAHILSSPSIEEASRAAKVGRVTIFKWLKDEKFKTALEKKREEFVQQAFNKLKANISSAIDVLIDLMKRAKTEGVRLNAAREVLAFFLKAKELEELSGRLTKIEKIVWERRFFE